MYNTYNPYRCPYCPNGYMHNPHNVYHNYRSHPCPYANTLTHNPPLTRQAVDPNMNKIKDYGPNPLVINIEDATKQNNAFRTTLWTGDHLQVTLMSIGVGEDIGLESHPHLDQFLRIEEGEGFVQMGDTKNNLDFQRQVKDDYVIIVPAGKWHNITNTGNKPIKLYSIYAPPGHPFGTVHATKAIAEAAEEDHGH